MNNLDLLYQLLRIRMVEEKISKEYSKEEMRCPVHLSIGQEAVAIALCSSLNSKDALFGGHRSHAHYLAKGGDLFKFFSELMGKSTGCAGGHGGSMHLVSEDVGFMGATSIVAGTLPVALGFAYSQKLRQSKNLTIACFGDGAIEEGVFWETLHMASRFKVPLILALENNNLACYTSINERRNPIDLELICQGVGLRYRKFDHGWDLFKINEEMNKIVTEIKTDPLPILCEFNVERIYEHCGHTIDNDLDYREESPTTEKDPLLFAIESLKKIDSKKITDEWLVAATKKISDEIESTYERARQVTE